MEPSWARTALSVPETRWAAVATALFASGGLLQLAGAPAPVWWAFYLGCYGTGGWEPALAGLRALRARTLDVDLLMIVAALAAAAIGQVLDGALLIVIFATSGALESFVTRRTADSVRALLSLAPDRATRVDADMTEQTVDAASLLVGDVIAVRPGERVGADGTVLDGLSEVDEASITGEPLPVVKRPGAGVYAGSVNGTGALRIEVRRPAAESVVARIAGLVEEASATKARRQLFIEKVEQRYSVGVVVATLVLVAVPLLLGDDFRATLLRAMTFMIVASPCAVVLATMPPLLAVIANAGRHGVLVKSATTMETLAAVDVIAFDKTGTLTEGRPRLVAIEPLPGFDADRLLGLAAAAERRSEHPLGGAVVAEARIRGLTVAEPTAFRSAPGRGVEATVEGHRIQVGTPAGSGLPQASALEATGRTTVVVSVDDRPAGVLAFADRVRADAPSTVRAVDQLTGRPSLVLTGDNQAAAGAVAAEVGIATVHAGLLPAQKLDRIRDLQTDGQRVMVIGDGVNDAPALTAADVGIAMGRRGADLTLQTADVVLVRDDLATLAPLLVLARRAHRVARANLAFAVAMISVLVLIDIIGTLPLPLGVAGHEGSTVIVGLNGLRLLRSGLWRRSTGVAPAIARTD